MAIFLNYSVILVLFSIVAVSYNLMEG